MNINLSTPEIISLAVWIVALVGVVLWGHTFRQRQRDIIGNRKYYYIFSALIVALALGGLLVRGLQWGLDFTGGTIIEVGAPQKVSMSTVQIAEIVRKKFPDLKDVQVQVAENLEISPEGKQYQKILVRAKREGASVELQPEESQQVVDELQTQFNVGELLPLGQTSIGPTVTGELKRGAILAIVVAMLLQLLYITFRFGNQMRFGLAADVALLHDVVIMVGLYALAGRQVDSPWVAALLTVAGYSVMDSVVIFDRIRENLKIRKGTFEQVVNESVNETMTRSVNTTLTTVIVCVALYFFGGATLKNFAFALLVGIISGAYSSIFVASPVLVELDKWARKREAERATERRLEAEERARTRKAEPADRTESYPTTAELPETGTGGDAAARRRRRTKGTRRRE